MDVEEYFSDRMIFSMGEVYDDALYLITRTQKTHNGYTILTMDAIGKSNAQLIVQSLADELAAKAETDPASAVAMIQHFNVTLAERLSQAQPRHSPNNHGVKTGVARAS